MNPSTSSLPKPVSRNQPRGEVVHRHVEYVTSQLRLLRHLPGVVGALLATVDGRTLLSDVAEPTPGAAAAITASSLALAERLGDLTGDGASVEELQVRSTAGYVCLYVVNQDVLLAVVTNHAVNLARLKLESRSVIDALRHTFSQQTTTSDTRNDPNAQ